jgi:hypothetical protein
MSVDLGSQLSRYLDAVAHPIGVDDVIGAGRLVELTTERGGPPRRRIAAVAASVAAATVALVAIAARPTPDDATPGGASAPSSAVTPATGKRHDGPLRMLLIGDSVTYSLSFGFEGSDATRPLVVVWNQARYNCELVDAPRRLANGREESGSPECANWRDLWIEARRVFEPEVIVAGFGPWELFDRRIGGRWLAFGSPEHDDVLLAELESVVDVLGADGTPVLFLTSPTLLRDDSAASPEWTAEEVWRVDHFNELLRTVVARHPDRSGVIELGSHLCPALASCTTSIDGVIVRPDGMHYEKPGASKVAPWIAQEVRRLTR